MADETDIEGRSAGGLHWADALALALFCLVLFGFAAFWGQALTLHEARLPELSREMMRLHDWFIPRSGGRPWLERPPLPDWIEIAFSWVFLQHCNHVWVVRLPAALAGMAGVVLTAWIAARWFGRWMGVASGLVLATTWEFYRYSTLAEDDIFLAALAILAVAFFVRAQWPPPARHVRITGNEGEPRSFFASRQWPVMGFFIALGLTNLVKGPLVGTAIVGISAGGFLLLKGDARSWRRYTWFFGWLVFGAITVFWPLAVMRRFPNVVHNWAFDYEGTQQYDEKAWYYVLVLGGILAPWTPAALLGLIVTAKRAFAARSSPQRFLWCWALLPILLLSIPHRKHHHYLLPAVAPWAILSVLALRQVARFMFRGAAWSRHPAFGIFVFGLPGAVALHLLAGKIPGPPESHLLLTLVWLAAVLVFYLGLWRMRPWMLLASITGAFLIVSCWAVRYVTDEKGRQAAADVAFLRHINDFSVVPAASLLTVNADLHGELYFFRNQFYLRPGAVLLHNLTYLRDSTIDAPDAYVVTRIEDASRLKQLGSVELIEQAHRAASPDDRHIEGKMPPRFALFLVHFDPELKRYPVPNPNEITAMQAMGREKGPYCGPPLVENQGSQRPDAQPPAPASEPAAATPAMPATMMAAPTPAQAPPTTRPAPAMPVPTPAPALPTTQPAPATRA